MANPQPLLLNANSSAFVFPQWNETSGRIILSPAETITLYCPQGVKDFDTKLVSATCIGGKSYQIGTEKLKLKSIRCVKHPWITVRAMPDDQQRDLCVGHNLTEVGFHAPNGAFLKTMTICHDVKRIRTFYTTYQMRPFNLAYQKNVGRLPFIQAREFNYSVSIGKLYSKGNQIKRLEKLLDDDTEDYYNEEKLFFSRGHLGGKVDFFFANHQRSTFFYLNSAPQWQSINGGNWQRVEDGIRRFVSRKRINATIVSGTHGTMRFPSLTDDQLFLGEKDLLPVPQYFYKIVYDENSRSGVVFISINNPHVQENEINDYVFCENVIEEIKWLSIRKTIAMGYVFACDVNQFMEEMAHNLLPNVVTTGLLL